MVRDLHQLVDPQAALSLRDSLLSLLKLKFSKGPRVIITQLCLALAGLALQVPNWERPVQTMMEQLGNQVDTHGILLEFLIVLPEEVRGNTRIPLMVSEVFGSGGIMFMVSVRMQMPTFSIHGPVLYSRRTQQWFWTFY